jgi:hypothetical protein
MATTNRENHETMGDATATIGFDGTVNPRDPMAIHPGGIDEDDLDEVENKLMGL